MEFNQAQSALGARPVCAVIFDLDGLMLDTEIVYREAFKAAALQQGFKLTNEFYRKCCAGRTISDCLVHISDLCGPEFSMQRFAEFWPDFWDECAAAIGIELKPGLLEVLDLLEDHGVLMAVATSTDRVYAEKCLRLAGIRGRFAALVAGDEVAEGKPAPDLFLAVCAKLSAAPAQCVVFEDSDVGAHAAAASGMRCVLVPDLTAPDQEVCALAAVVLRSLEAAPALLAPLLRGDVKPACAA